ncbi:MAG TPA: hypothetical protein VMS55_06810 [Myxococcota bacterium]|nr:hypothetical protein [Myxococcota bacterium]
MKLQNLSRAAIAALVAAVGIAGSASAAPISMVSGDGDGIVHLDGVIGSFDLTLASGDTATNSLVFQLVGNPPAIGVGAIVFDGTSILSASELSDPDHLLTGLVLPNSHTVAGILVDFGSPSQASFRVVLGSTPTTATVFSLNLTGTSSFYTSTSWQTFALDKERVRFTSDGGTPVPEPAAALCFAAGLALVASRARRP